ncbi:MAG: hypothetical protein J5627_02705 [Bacilli bacterium]|nr:hypothetical protein [Bacilli bacterium]
MLNFLLFIALFVFSISAYSFSYTSTGIINTFSAFDFTYAQNAVVSDPYGGPAYFERKLFVKIASRYFTESLSKYYVSAWNVDLDFKDGDGVTLGTPYLVNVTFDCTFNGTYHYHSSKGFEIRKGKAL